MSPRRDSGAAVITALLITALGVLLVSGAFLRQAVVVRQVQNAAEVSQTRWLLAGAIDWVRVILREDARTSAVDHAGEPWATPLGRTRLDNGDREPAWLSGRVEDGQSRFNLRGLAVAGELPVEDVAVLGRLLAYTGSSGVDVARFAQRLRTAMMIPRLDAPSLVVASVEDIVLSETAEVEALQRLKPFVTLLPVQTPINVNTAPAEVLAARFPELSLSDARAVVEARNRAVFRDLPDFEARLAGTKLAGIGQAVVMSRVFVLDGLIEHGRARLAVRVVLQRANDRVQVLWQRDDLPVPAPPGRAA